MENIEITKVPSNNILELLKISKQTFIETFSSGNTADNLNKYLNENLTEEKLFAELNDINTEFYFAILDKNKIGYLKLNFGQSQTEIKNDKAIEIERIYVIKEFQGTKIGQMLLKKAIGIAKQSNADYVWLGVWEKNQRAINFYKRNGFLEFDKHIFKLGNDEQTDIMMKLSLKPNS